MQVKLGTSFGLETLKNHKHEKKTKIIVLIRMITIFQPENPR
jgi:hypothetical protein